MKNFLLILLVVLVSGCGIKKKMVTTNNVIEKKTVVETSLSNDAKTRIDTTKSDDLEVTYSKIEYYPPSPVIHPAAANDTTNQINQVPAQPAIKSVESYTVRHKKESKGVTAVENKTVQTTSQTDTTRIVQQETKTSEPGKDPKRFRYIFWTVFLLLAAGAAFFLYKKKDKIPFVQTVLSWVRGILKI